MSAHNDSLSALRALRTFQGREGAFWFSYAEHACRLFSAERVFLMRRGSEGWKTFCFWPLSAAKNSAVELSIVAELAEKTEHNPVASHLATSGELLSFRLHSSIEDGEMMALLYFAQGIERDRNQDQLKRELLFDIPVSFRMLRKERQAVQAGPSLPDPLDVMLCVNEHTGFLSASMALCNELASRFGCSRVTLGWKEGEYVRLQAVSNTERFDQKMSIVQSLELVMEECMDQDEELLLPEIEGNRAVVREHGGFMARQGVLALLSLPLRIEHRVVAVLSCERDTPFTAEEVRSLRIICDQVTRRLADLKHYDRWIGKVLLDGLKGWWSELIGGHTDKRIYLIAATLLMAFLLFGRMEYRVEAPFILRTKDLALLSAPFDGYIEKVSRKAGDLVTVSQPLLSLDIRQMLLEESRSAADVQRYMQDEKKAMAQNALADMKVSEALRRQADSRYQMIRYNLDHAEIRAPFNGVVVEGDLEKLLGAPVRKGDVLLKVARLENLYVEMKVPERDIHEFKVGQSGEVAFISQPGKKFVVIVERIEPMALAEQKGNVFLVLGRITEKRQGWWRPGMSGVAKLSVGKRHILWILLHRTLDFFFMKFWW